MKYLIIIFSAVVLFTSCKSKVPEAKSSETENTKKEEAVTDERATNIVELTAAQMKAVGMQTDTIQFKDLTTTVKVNGILTVPNQNKALVTSVTNGIVQTLLVQPGDFVKKGQLIATIINPDVAQIQQQLQTANAQIQMAEIEQNRQKELVEGNAAPLKNLQRLTTEMITLKATKNSLQQQLSSMGISTRSVNSGRINTVINILAPINGTISQVIAQIGSNVNSSAPIATIVNNDQLHLDIFVYEKDLPKIKEKQTIHFVLTNMQDKEYDAQIYAIGAAFANDTKTVPVHAIVKGNKTGLIEGMNITALISTGTSKVMAVPTDAIVTNASQDYIFIQSNKEESDSLKGKKEKVNTEKERSVSFEKIRVTKGISDIGFTQIIPINPIPKESKIITKGAFFVLAKMTNKGEEE